MDLAETVFVKLGGSLITDKSRPYTAREDVLQRLGREIHEARRARPLALLVGHGGGSFPHTSASQYGTARGIVDERSWEGFVKVHEDAVRLNTLVRGALERAGEVAISIQPSAAAVTRRGRIATWDARPIGKLLAAGVIPVPYGDVCVDEEQGCAIVSTEEVLRHLAAALRPARVLLVGKVDGVLDAAGQVIPRLDRAGLASLGGELRSDGAADVTGGMRHKLERAFEMGAPTEIINGLVPGVLRRALEGERGLGTIIDA
jgi:isopentenyl phosphate kinase